MKHTRQNALELLRHLLVSVLTALIALGPAPLALAGVVTVDPRVQQRAGTTNVWDITFKDGAIIRYRSFDVANGQEAHFIPTTGADSRVLNRITSATPTKIDGIISGSGRIYIVNPAGVFFGADAQVNVTALQAAAGNLSDRDFKNKDDHFTNLKGRVENAGTIVANAASLVGREVVNSGAIDTDGWIVLAAGRDVFIGRDANGNGLLLRVEGGADAVFNKKATGVTNTGQLTVEATPPATPENPNPTPLPAGRISLGAGDLYGTAIFNTGAIKAREIAMQASNKGDVALAGEVRADTLDVSFAGNKTGSLRSASGTVEHTLNANTVNLTATSAKGQVNVADRFLLRSEVGGGPTANVNVEQKATLQTSKLAKLDVASPSDTAHTKLGLQSDTAIDIDDKQLVTGTQLTVDAPTTAIRGAAPLVVERLDAQSRLLQSESDIVATGEDAKRTIHDPNQPNDPNATIDVYDPVMRFAGNVELITKPGALAEPGTLLSAKRGTLSTVGDVTTSAGGGIRIEAGDVKLGTLNSDGTLSGGSILSSGDALASVTITADNQGLDPRLTGSVQAKSIITRAAAQAPGVDSTAGGDVTINAPGNITLFGDILAEGGAGLHSGDPTHDGGSVRLTAGDAKTITVHNITTGGGNAPHRNDREHGEILLDAGATGTIVLKGNLNASAGEAKNATGTRNRSVTLDGAVKLDADTVAISGGNVDVSGKLTEGQKHQDPQDPNSALVDRTVDLTINSGSLLLGGGAEVQNLNIANLGAGPVLFGADVTAEDSVKLKFDTDGVARWGTTLSADPVPVPMPVTVTADHVEVDAGHPPADLAGGAAASIALDPSLHFKLTTPPTDASDPHPSFTFWQGRAIDQSTTDALFTPGRFVDGIAGSTLLLRSNSSLSFSQSAIDDVLGTDLKLIGDSFVALPGPTARFDVASFELTTLGALDADFDVIARGTRSDQIIGIRAGATGTGDLTVRGNLQGREILLVAGDGATEGGGTTAAITVADSARFSNAAGTAAPEIFGLQQDASLDTSSLPALSQFAGGSITGAVPMQYRLESLDGAVSLLGGTSDRFTGSNLFLNGQTGINLGSEPLELAGLIAKTRSDLQVLAPITVTTEDGVIDLSAGDDATGDLRVDAKLTADRIDLRAGAGDGVGATSRVVLENGASFAGVDASSTTAVRPEHFAMIQDGSMTSGDLPTPTDFAGGTVNGMDLELRSLGGALSIDDTGLIADTALALQGKTGVSIALGGLGVGLRSLDAKGPLTLDGSIATAGDMSIDTTVDDVERGVTLDAPATNSLATNQLLVAGGALTVKGTITKTTDGHIELGSGAGHDLEIGDVATAHTGGGIAIHGGADVKTGALDASGAPPTDPTGLAVSVIGAGSVDVASINATGATGASRQPGKHGGNVEVTGAELRLGTVNASGGKGGSTLGGTAATNGGDAGSITLTATGASQDIAISGDLLALGGEGVASLSASGSRGAANDVDVHGSLLLLAKAADGPIDSILGRSVVIDGAVLPGTEKLTADADPTPIAPSATGLRIVADDALTIGGDITAGNLDLELHKGPLDLGTKTIRSDTIRLAATDGKGGPQTDGEVDLSGLDFHGANGTRRIVSLTVEQDKGFGGPDGSPIPDAHAFTGTSEENEPAVSLGLISQDNAITLGAADIPKVQDTRLTLASNKTPADPNSPADAPIQIDGGALSLKYLQLGSAIGVGGAVGGNTNVVGDLSVGGAGVGTEALRSYGNLWVNGNAHVAGAARFAGEGNQLFDVTGTLDLGGTDVTKSSTGNLDIEAARIDLTSPTAQTISNEGGTLTIGGALVKGDFNDADGDGNPDPNRPPLLDPNDPNGPLAVGQRGLALSGVSEDARQAAVVIKGDPRSIIDTPGSPTYAIAVGNGDLSIRAILRPAGSSTPETGTYQLGGDVLAFGDIFLSGEGSFLGAKPPAAGGKPLYTVEARRNPFELAGGVLSGELTMGGVLAADGDLRLVARGDDPSVDVPHPVGIHLQGNFANLAGSLELEGSVDFADATSIDAAGDVSFDSRIQGDKGLSVKSGGQVALFDDVAMTSGALSLAGDSGVRFVSSSDTQFVQAGSISLGSGAARSPSGVATLVRDGNLSLTATGGDVAIANGQRMVVNGSLDVSAPKTISLTDTAALRIKLVSHDLVVRGGSTVIGNSIVSSARPEVTGNGRATFAVPTVEAVSDSIPGKDILLRQINSDGSPLSLASAFADPDVLFPTVPFPAVTGPAQFDYALQTPLPPARRALTRPHVDALELDASLANRPLWADELLAYLEQRSLETPGVSEAVEHLPPVGARPGDSIEPEDRRVRSAAAERAVALYRELFRPDVARDPETGFIAGPGRADAIRAAFQAPIDTLRRQNGGKPVSGAALRELIASTPSFAAAQGYGAQLGQLVAAGELALTPDQKPRFQTLVLSEVTPYGIAPAEFATAIR